MKRVLLTCLLFVSAVAASSQTQPQQDAANPSQLSACGECIRKHMEFLASDELRGRGSGTDDERRAAEYIGAQLKTYGISPAGDDQGFVQKVRLLQPKLSGPPILKVAASDSYKENTLVYGKDFLTSYLSATQFSGRLQKLNADTDTPKADAGAMVLIFGKDPQKVRNAAIALASSQATGVLMATNRSQESFQQRGQRLPRLPARIADKGEHKPQGFNALELTNDAVHLLTQLPEGTEIQFDAPSTEDEAATWNAVGILRGGDPVLQHAAILFSAHLDHVGIGKAIKGDNIYNGADDDASGTVAVLELARVLGAGSKPKRTIIFALFGSEETGGMGANYFREHPPVPLKDIAANLEFEMIGRPDAAVKADTVWLSGWERSNLGPTLAEHGAHLVGDPHPEQNFFARSDNYVLAQKGVVAQTISSFGLHAEYHQPNDDLAHIDFKHMTEAIGSLLAPVEWLVNSDFKPQWNQGGQP